MLQSSTNLSSARCWENSRVVAIIHSIFQRSGDLFGGTERCRNLRGVSFEHDLAKPHETREKMSILKAEDLLSKISIKPSTSLFSSDVDWISEGSKENLRKLGLKADTLESTILQLENLKSNLGALEKIFPEINSKSGKPTISNGPFSGIQQDCRNHSHHFRFTGRGAKKGFD